MRKHFKMMFGPKYALLLLFSIALLLTPTGATAQNTPETLLDAADGFFQQGNYEASATEYQRFLFFAPEHPSAQYAYYQLGLTEQQLGRQHQAIQAFRRAFRNAPRGRHRQHISYRLALAYLAADQLDRAKMELLGLAVSSRDSVLATQASVVAAIAYAYQQRWEQAGEMLQRASSLQEDVEAFQENMKEAEALVAWLKNQPTLKSSGGAKWASTILPGSGQMYAGRLWNGVTALAINVGTSYLLYRSIATESYVDAGLLASSVWWRYYQGNRLHAEEAAIRVNQQHYRQLEDRLYMVIEEAGQFLPDNAYRPGRARDTTLQSTPHSTD